MIPHDAFHLWATTLSSLQQSISQYVSQTSILIQTLHEPSKPSSNTPGIASWEDVLEGIDHHLGSISLMEAELCRSRTQLRKCRNISHRLVPIHRLPSEILSHIVVLGELGDQEKSLKHHLFAEAESMHQLLTRNSDQELDPADPDYEQLSYSDPVYFPVLFSSVCQRWREVSLGTASFWDQIDFGKSIEHAQALLARSKACPIKVILDPKSLPIIERKHFLHFVYDILRPHISRIASIVIQNYPYPSHITQFLCKILIPSSLSLHRLVLTLEYPGQQLDLGNNDEILEAFKQLEVATFDGIYPSWDNLKFQELKFLLLRRIVDQDTAPTFNQFHSMLSSCPKLEALVIDNIFLINNPRDRTLTGQIPLPHLHTLRINQDSDLDEDWTEEFILSIIGHTPELTGLTIRSLRAIGAPLSRFIERHNGTEGAISKIDFLRILDCEDISSATLRKILRKLPNVTDFGIRHIDGFTNNVLKEMVFDEKIGSAGLPLLPHLKILRLVSCHGLTSARGLKRFVESRKRLKETFEWATDIEKLVVMFCNEIVTSQRMGPWFHANVKKFYLAYDEGTWEHSESEEGSEDGMSE